MGVDFRGNVMEVDALDFGRGVTMRLRPGTTCLEILNGTFSPLDLQGVHQVGAGEELVINDDGVNADFRVEGDTDVNLLFADASTDRVGIGTNAPAALLDVDGISRASQLQSDIATGTAPFIVASTTTVANLDAATAALAADSSLLGGLAATAFAILAGQAGGQTLHGGNASGNELTLRGSSVGNDDGVRIFNNIDAVSFAILDLRAERATRANLDEIFINFTQPNSIGSPFEFTRLSSVASGVTSGNESGAFQFDVSNASGLVQGLRVDGNFLAVIVNDDAADFDFRCESSTETHLFVVDAGRNAVAVGGPAQTAQGQLQVEVDTDEVSSEMLRLRSVRATRAVNDEIFISMYQPDGGGGQSEFGRITNLVSAVGAGSEGGRMEFAVSCQDSGGTLQEFFRIDGSSGNEEFLFNPTGSADFDFRCSVGSENFLLHVDSGLTTVGIGGVATASVQLTIEMDNDLPTLELLRLRSVSATPAIDDSVDITANMRTLDLTQEEMARISFISRAVTNTTESGAIDFTVPSAGVSHRLVRFESSTPGIVFSPDQVDINFVIRSVSIPCAFEMDSGRNTVGIGRGAQSSVQLAIQNPLLDAASIEMIRISTSGRVTETDADESYIGFQKNDDVGAENEVGRLNMIASDVSAATFRGQFMIEVADGAATSAMQEAWRVGEDNTGALIFGYFGSTQARSTYTRNATVVEDRTLLQSSAATALNNNNVLAAIIADLQAHGMFLGT